jgi:hypothetical protein
MRNKAKRRMFHAFVWISQLAARAVTWGADELRTRLGTLLLPLQTAIGPSRPHSIHTFEQFDISPLTVLTSKTWGLDWEETLGKDAKGELHKYYSNKWQILTVIYGTEFALSKRLIHKIRMRKTKFYLQMYRRHLTKLVQIVYFERYWQIFLRISEDWKQ